MSKRRIALGVFASCLAAVLSAGVFLLALPGPSGSVNRINQANYNRIKIGMAAKDVKAILGGPPSHQAGTFRYLDTRPSEFFLAKVQGRPWKRGWRLSWEGRRNTIEVWVSDTGPLNSNACNERAVVYETMFWTNVSSEKPPQSLLDRFRAWIWLRWRRPQKS